MKRALRLRSAADYSRVKEKGRVFRQSALSLALHPNHLAYNRYGFVVSRAVGGAVSRNRCKRRLRALLAQLHDNLVQGYDIVFIARAALPAQPFCEMRRIVIGLLARARLLVETC